jgi:hypothetical protein
VAGTSLVSGTATFHTPRLDARRTTLKNIFAITAMDRVWRDYVRPGLRDQEILDLHDYCDFHWGRNALLETLEAEISSGRYVPQRSIPVRVEKRHGVTRTLVIPSPQDAIVLQCIVERILPAALKAQPLKNAFFSAREALTSFLQTKQISGL